jgi:hypothetical protein
VSVILAYCIVADPQLSLPVTGVSQKPVREIVYQDLRCFFSQFERAPERFTKENALEFHATVQFVFRRAAVIPFRFPTVIKSEADLHQFLAEKSGTYTTALAKLRNVVQMELRIVSEQSGDSAKKPSGKQYMAERLKKKQALEQAAKAARSAAGGLAREWRQRETQEGLRCYALVARDDITPFQDAMKSLSAGAELQVMISGPWPATEFIE